MKTAHWGAILILGMLHGMARGQDWTPLPVSDDPLLRMPGTQPAQGVNLEASNRCLNCHANYNSSVEPGANWMGSMMAQAARDPIWYACMTVAAQDSIWALGNPNATDLCIRCHSPAGWLGGRSDPTNASALVGDDFDGLSCDFCHTKWDPMYALTFDGSREGADWAGYWDEAGALPGDEALTTLAEDAVQATGIRLFRGAPFFVNGLPRYSTYDADVSGQYFVSTGSQKRASFADASARHQMLYSRVHKSKYFCGTCHDVSNPVLANLGLSGLPDLSGGADVITEQYTASGYFHVERTFSEFMLSAYGQQGGAATNVEFQAQGAPGITWAAKCQDCHMRDVTGVACNKNGAILRPEGSASHPSSGLPLHDMTGGNLWIMQILASTDPGGPIYDATNAQLLDQGPAVLTLDLNAGQSPVQNGAALMAGADRARQQLLLAATLQDAAYDASAGTLGLRVQNNCGHKLISGFPEGRRMFLNVQLYQAGRLVYEVNPYDAAAGTLKGLPNSTSSPPLAANEVYADELVYEVHPASSLTGEQETFHFVLATGRYKDNRIPPKGFDIANASARLAEPVWHGVSDTGLFTAEEYAGGYDDVALSVPAGADVVAITLYYQGTSREYIEFLRDEIAGTADSLASPTPAGLPEAYLAQTDAFFDGLRAWGPTIWSLWEHNHGLDGSGVEVPGIVPFAMARVVLGAGPTCTAPVPTLLSATPGHTQVTLSWSDEHGADPAVVGYRIYYDEAGKAELVAEVGATITSHVDTGLTDGQTYCYEVSSLYDADGDSAWDCESAYSGILCATPDTHGLTNVGVTQLQTGRLVVSGKGSNRVVTFELATGFTAGETVVIRAEVTDAITGLPVADAMVDLQIDGPESVTLFAVSDAAGVAEAGWSTSSPNRHGQGGTTPGSYSVTVTNVGADGYAWDGTGTTTAFTLQ